MTFIAPKPLQLHPSTVAMTAPTSNNQALASSADAPESSLHALRTFNRRQVHRSRARQQTKSMAATATVLATANTPNSFASEENPLNTPQHSCMDQPFIGSPNVFPNVQLPGGELSDSPKHWTTEVS